MMNEKLIENLKAAKALIDTPEKWGKGTYEPGPDCYCVVGALKAANGWSEFEVWNTKAINALYSACDDRFEGIVDLNDHPDTTHADIMALIDRAIAAAEAAQ